MKKKKEKKKKKKPDGGLEPPTLRFPLREHLWKSLFPRLSTGEGLLRAARTTNCANRADPSCWTERGGGEGGELCGENFFSFTSLTLASLTLLASFRC